MPTNQQQNNDDKRREVTKSDTVSVGANDMNREPLPDDRYLDGIIEKVELREGVVNNFDGSLIDKLHFTIELPDVLDEEGDNEFRKVYGSAKLSMHPKSNLYKWVKAIFDMVPPDGSDFHPANLIACPCRVLVKTWENEDGSIGQTIGDFKPFTGDLKKGMNDPNDVFAGAFAAGKVKKTTKKTSKKTTKKKSSKKSDDGPQPITESGIEVILAGLKEGGAELVTEVSEALAYTKKSIKEAVKAGVDGDRDLLTSIYLFLNLEKRKFEEEQFERMDTLLAQAAEHFELDPDSHATFSGLACRVLAMGGGCEWPRTITGAKESITTIAESGSLFSEGGDEEPDPRPAVGTAGEGKFPDDGNMYACTVKSWSGEDQLVVAWEDGSDDCEISYTDFTGGGSDEGSGGEAGGGDDDLGFLN